MGRLADTRRARVQSDEAVRLRRTSSVQARLQVQEHRIVDAAFLPQAEDRLALVLEQGEAQRRVVPVVAQQLLVVSLLRGRAHGSQAFVILALEPVHDGLRGAELGGDAGKHGQRPFRRGQLGEPPFLVQFRRVDRQIRPAHDGPPSARRAAARSPGRRGSAR